MMDIGSTMENISSLASSVVMNVGQIGFIITGSWAMRFGNIKYPSYICWPRK